MNRPKMLPNPAPYYWFDFSLIPDQIRVSFEDGTTAVYDLRCEQPHRGRRKGYRPPLQGIRWFPRPGRAGEEAEESARVTDDGAFLGFRWVWGLLSIIYRHGSSEEVLLREAKPVTIDLSVKNARGTLGSLINPRHPEMCYNIRRGPDGSRTSP